VRSYPYYGGRGISVCESWTGFAAFIAEMGIPPPGAQIDRIDNDGNYEPGNCRWTTSAENSRNRSSTRLNAEAAKVLRHLHRKRPATLLARLYGVARRTVSQVQTGVTWKPTSTPSPPVEAREESER
jgi:hypothetical protein